MNKDILFSMWYDSLEGTKSQGFAYKAWCAGWEAAAKPWVSLTDEEIESIVDANTEDDAGFDIFCYGHGVARAIETKLKEKNT